MLTANISQQNRFTLIISSIVLCISLIVIYGWATENDLIVRLQPQLTSMKLNTALGFLFSSAATIAFYYKKQSIIYVFCFLSIAIHTLTILQHLFTINIGIDNLIINDTLSSEEEFPGRSSLNTSLSFVMVGTTLVLFTLVHKFKYARLIAGITSGSILALCSTSLIGYLLEINSAYSWGIYSAMAAHTSIGFCLLGTVLLFNYYEKNTAKNQQPTHPLLIPTAALMLVLNLSLFIALQVQNNRYLNTLVESQLEIALDEIKGNLDTHIALLSRITKHWKLINKSNLDEWQYLSTEYINITPGLTSIILLNKDLEENWKTGNTYTEEKDIKDTIKHYLKNNTDFYYRSNYRQFIKVKNSETTYIFLTSATDNNNQNGYLIGTINTNLLFQQALGDVDIDITVEDDKKTIFSKITTKTKKSPKTNYQSKEINQYNINWIIKGAPSALIIKRSSSKTSYILFSTLLALTGVFIYILQTNRKLHFISKEIDYQKNRFQSVFENLANSIILASENGKILLTNKKTLTTFGYSKEELIGNNIEILIPVNYRESHPKLRDKYAANPSAKAMNTERMVHALTKSGQEIPVEITLSPIKSNQELQIVASIKNVSEREEYVRKLKIINQELESFAYIASHDLKSPLRGIDQLAT